MHKQINPIYTLKANDMQFIAQQLIQVSVGGFLGLFVGLSLSDLVEVLVNFIAKFSCICQGFGKPQKQKNKTTLT